ncbi:MAG: GspMb/PilO family protein [Pseudomonadota bacterium]
MQVSLWPVDDPAATRARMQSTVARLAEDHGVTLRRAQTLDDADVDALKAAALRIEFEAPYDRFLRFVSAVHDHDPPLLLRQGVARRSPTRYEGVDQPIVFAQFQLLAPLAETPAEGVDE